MYVKRLLVKGYRSLRDIDIPFQAGINVLVGKNNSGKSNLLRALDLLFGEKWPPSHDIEDSWFFGQEGARDDFLLIAAWLEPGPIPLRDEAVVYWRLWDEGPDWNDPETLLVDTDVKRIRIAGALAKEAIGRARQAVLYFCALRTGDRQSRSYALALQDDEGNWKQVTMNNELRDAMLTTALIPAFRSGTEQLRINSYSWYGKLVRHLYSRRSDDQAKQLHALQQEMKRVAEDIFHDATGDLRQFLTEVVFHNKIRLQVGSDLEEDIYKQLMLFIDDGVDTPYTDKGAGIQSALVVGLFTYYCRTFHKGSSLLLVEEPELHLHPHARRALHKRIVEFSEGHSEGDERQVILCTHSPEFVRSVDLSRVIRVYKDSTTNATGWRAVSDLSPDESSRYLQITRTNPEMFFADHVILVEGGEVYLLPPLADKIIRTAGVLDSHNIGVARVGGKTQFSWYVRVLEDLGIGWSILADLDLLVQGISDFEKRLPERLIADIRRIKEAASQVGGKPTGKKVSGAMHPENLDWVTLYRKLEGAICKIASGQALASAEAAEIQALWSRIKERVERPSLVDAIREAGLQDLLQGIVEQLRLAGIFLHGRGDLESCLTEDAKRLDDSKDRRALAVAERVEECSSLEDVRRWIEHLDAFEAVLTHALECVRTGRGYQVPDYGSECDELAAI